MLLFPSLSSASRYIKAYWTCSFYGVATESPSLLQGNDSESHIILIEIKCTATTELFKFLIIFPNNPL